MLRARHHASQQHCHHSHYLADRQRSHAGLVLHREILSGLAQRLGRPHQLQRGPLNGGENVNRWGHRRVVRVRPISTDLPLHRSSLLQRVATHWVALEPEYRLFRLYSQHDVPSEGLFSSVAFG